jgi:hypothetical protein
VGFENGGVGKRSGTASGNGVRERRPGTAVVEDGRETTGKETSARVGRGFSRELV